MMSVEKADKANINNFNDLNESFFLRKAIVCIVLCWFRLCIAANKEVPCESILNDSWSYVVIGSLRSCSMTGKTVIDSIGYTINSTDDTTVLGLNFYTNKKVQFLPENIAQKFPNLEGYFAHECSIEGIAKINFKGLHRLRRLELCNNKIETVDQDTFEDLNLLERLTLCKFQLISKSFLHS